MKLIRRLFMTALVSFGFIASQSANAGVPTADGMNFSVNLENAISQVLAWDQQYNQMVSQINGITAQVNALTGTRNLGDILNNPLLQGIVPSNLGTLYTEIGKNGFSSLSGAAKTLRTANAIYNCEDRTGTFATQCQASLGMNAQAQTDAQNVLGLISQRTDQIQTLQSSINATADPMAIAQLQARIQAENTQVTNDINRAAVAKQLADLQQQAADQAMREQVLTLYKPTTPRLSFTYTPPTP